jgi:hypothetical protein
MLGRLLPLLDCEMPLFNHQMPLLDCEMPLFNHEMPLFNHEMPLLDCEMSLFNHETSLLNHEMSLFDFLRFSLNGLWCFFAFQCLSAPIIAVYTHFLGYKLHRRHLLF